MARSLSAREAPIRCLTRRQWSSPCDRKAGLPGRSQSRQSTLFKNDDLSRTFFHQKHGLSSRALFFCLKKDLTSRKDIFLVAFTPLLIEEEKCGNDLLHRFCQQYGPRSGNEELIGERRKSNAVIRQATVLRHFPEANCAEAVLG